MAARDPQKRAANARTAARARINGLTPQQRRDMTATARDALRQADLDAVDNEAIQLGQHPLDPATRAFRAGVLAAIRAKKASDAAKQARAQRATQTTNQPTTEAGA